MEPTIQSESMELGGRTLTLETGKLAGLADGSVLATYGETVILATAVISDPRDDIDYFPLSVVYEEKLYAGGLIKGSPWVKREGRPRDEATLYRRMIDRSIRPLFANDFKNDVQVVITVLSVDQENDPSTIGLIAASAALNIAGAPWIGPVAGVTVGKINDSYVINPLLKTEKEYSELDLFAASTKEKTVMIEAGAEEVSEAEIVEAIRVGFEENKKAIEMIERFTENVGRTVIEYDTVEVDEDLDNRIHEYIRENFDISANEVKSSSGDKIAAREERDAFMEQLFDAFEGKTTKSYMADVYTSMRKKEIRRLALEEGKRFDGRGMDEVRSLYMEVGFLPRTHGSGLFTRGGTQALTVTTLGSTSLEQLSESMFGEDTKRYIHHYNFPPYSVGETGRIGGPGSREIGHGALAEKALEPVIPGEDLFPYTIRVVSEILSSNGSSSMASVCGSTLSLMDAGVPIKKPVAGIAMGLIEDEDKKLVLTDLSGVEDMAGFMDFKVAGTRDGVTAIQVDVKNDGLDMDLIQEIVEKARTARLGILEQMEAIIHDPREKLSDYAPKVVTVKIDPEKIGEVIGPGGKIIKAIQADTDTVIEIQEDGTVHITGIQQEGIDNARQRIEGITKEPEVGEEYDGEVKRIVDFGAFVEYLPGKEGLVHISKISKDYVENVRDHLNEGDKVHIKIIEIDDRGRVNLGIVTDDTQE